MWTFFSKNVVGLLIVCLLFNYENRLVIRAMGLVGLESFELFQYTFLCEEDIHQCLSNFLSLNFGRFSRHS